MARNSHRPSRRIAKLGPTANVSRTNQAGEIAEVKIGIGADHAGYEYKEQIKAALEAAGHTVVDFGTHSREQVDYPAFIRPVAEAVAAGEIHRGIVLGGSGNGEAIAANRVPGVRCAVCWNRDTAVLARRHNDANMISLGQRMISPDEASAIVEAWLTTPFDGGRHTRRIYLIEHPEELPPATPLADA